MKLNHILQGDSLELLKTLPDNSIDLVCTDPPYGYSFMGKNWDKAVPSVEVWKQCLRVLKPGGFAFVMSAPRSDVLSRMIVRIEDAGFRIDFTPIYWTYASGFPKAMNIGKMVDKRKNWDVARDLASKIKMARQTLGFTKEQAFRKCKFDAQTFGGNSWFEDGRIPSKSDYHLLKKGLHLDNSCDSAFEEVERQFLSKETNWGEKGITPISGYGAFNKTKGASPLEGSYGGFQPKPAVEVIIVAMKPLSEKTYVDQALKNGKGITWLDDARIPVIDLIPAVPQAKGGNGKIYGFKNGEGRNGDFYDNTRGRFPANLLVQDDVLNDGRVFKTGAVKPYTENHQNASSFQFHREKTFTKAADSGSYSRYFNLDAWAKTLPFLIVPKASKSEKGKDCTHPTVKPLKLMSYLITLGSRPKDVVLDPFLGSGTTALAAKELGRSFIGIEREREYVKIAKARINSILL